MKPLIFLLFVINGVACFAQDTIIKPTSICLELGGVQQNIAFKFNRVYSVKKKVAYSYELGASPFLISEDDPFQTKMIFGWSALTGSKKDMHFELGALCVVGNTEPDFGIVTALRYQDFYNPKFFMRFGILPVYTYNYRVWTGSLAIFSIGYSIK